MHESTDPSRRRFLRSAGMVIAAATAQSGAIAYAKARAETSPLGNATTWLNSPPLTEAQFQGKVVVVDFWTYSCINWRRQLPYVRAWAQRYGDLGLTVVGVHSPEFSFEKNIDNVRWAAKDMRITYPIAIDNDFGVWRGFNNEYWPALYFIDGVGRLRHSVFGEGQYDESEVLIRKLLIEAGAANLGDDRAWIEARGAETPADWRNLRSEENYLGYRRTENFASPSGIKADQAHLYIAKGRLKLNQWDLSGAWTVGAEALRLSRPSGSISYCFHARDLHLVMGPPPGKTARFRVLIDGEPPADQQGVDVDKEGNGIANEPRMYQLIRQQPPIVDKQFTIQFLDSGVAAFSFTFG